MLDYAYFNKHYNIIACDLSKQNELDADPGVIQPLEIIFMLDTNSQILAILEKLRETILEFNKGTTKVL